MPNNIFQAITETGLMARAITLYHDHDAEEIDGNGWCVEFSDGETTYRFVTITDALAFVDAYRNWFTESRSAGAITAKG